MRLHLFLIASALSFCLCGCVAAVPSIVQDERSLDDQSSDMQIEASLKSELLKYDARRGTSVNVYSFRGHVYLIGEGDHSFREFAEQKARSTPGMRRLTTRWFTPGSSDLVQDTQIESAIDSNLLFAKDVASTRVHVDVWGGHVILLGIMADQDEIRRAIAETHNVAGVKSVTSYLVTNAESQRDLPVSSRPARK